MAVAMKVDLISEDLWTLPEAYADIHELQVKDFSAWVRKQARQFGRKAEICDQRYSAVEMWLKELGIDAGFVAGGEVNYNNQFLYSDFQNIGYYMFAEDGMMEVKAGRWLEICKFDNQEDYLIGR